MPGPRVAALFRHPVKGFTPESLGSVELVTDGTFPGDRLFAVENGPSGFDPDAPEHRPKVAYLMLMRHAALARLETRYVDAEETLVVAEDGRELLRARLDTAEGRATFENMLANRFADVLRGPPRVLRAPDGFRFMDSRSGFVSILNRASIDDLARAAGRPIDPRRFRGNILLEGLAPWAELDLVGRTLSLGSVSLTVLNRIDRCAAIDVDPVTATRETQLVRTLDATFGHVDCGIYARVIAGGRIDVGDPVALPAGGQTARTDLPF